MAKTQKTIAFLLAGILVFGFLMRLVAWRLDPIISRDGAFYLIEAQGWSTSPGSFQYDQPPLLMLVLRLFYQMGLNAEFWGCLLNIAMGVILIFAAYKITELLLNSQTAGLYAALILAIHPYLIQISYQIQRESLYFALMSIILWRLVKFGCRNTTENNHCIDGILIGVLLALAVLSRHEGWLFFPFLLLVSIFYGLTNHQWGRVLKHLSFFFLSFSIAFLILAFTTDLFRNIDLIVKSQLTESFGSF